MLEGREKKSKKTLMFGVQAIFSMCAFFFLGDETRDPSGLFFFKFVGSEKRSREDFIF